MCHNLRQLEISSEEFYRKWGSLETCFSLISPPASTHSCWCCCSVTSVVSNSVRPHRQQPTRLPRPWDSPGKSTGVGCYFLLQWLKVKSESEVAQSCLTLHNPMDCSLPGSSIHGIFQARVLEWGAIAFSSTHSNIPQNIRVSGEGRLPGEEHLSQLGKEVSLGKNDNLVRAFQDHTF